MENNISLSEYLKKYEFLKYGMIAQCALIKEIEIYAFANCSKDMFEKFRYNQYHLLGIVDKDSTHQVIRGTYMYQVVEWYDGEKVQHTGITTPLYLGLRLSKEDTEMDIANLYIPDLISNELYKIIRSRRGSGVEVTPQLVNRYKVPKGIHDIWSSHNIEVKDGKAYLPVKKGDILCIHAVDHAIKSIGQEIIAICRYTCKETGRLVYANFNLDELTIEDKDDNGYYDLL